MKIYLEGLKNVLEGYQGLLRVVDDFIEGHCADSSGLGLELDEVEGYLKVVRELLAAGITELEVPEKTR